MYNQKAKHAKFTIKKWRYLIVLFLVVFVVIPISFSKYIKNLNETLTLTIRKPGYTVKFNSNRNDGNPDQIETQSFVYGTPQQLRANTFTKTDFYFQGWNTQTDGNGTSYVDEQEVSDLSSVDGGEVTLYAQWTNGVARIGTTYYTTLQAAINAVPKNNTETTVELLTNVKENISVDKNQYVKFDFQNHTLSATANAVVNNAGTIKMINGTISTTATNEGAFNIQSTGRLIMTGGSIINTAVKGKQAIYNNKGIVEISGTAYIRNASSSLAGNNIRAAVQNVSGGTLTITGGTIVGENYQGVANLGTMTIGTQDGNPDKTSLEIRGATDGVNSTTNFSFFDGTIKGKTAAVNADNKITTKETGYNVAYSGETIGNDVYRTAYLATNTNMVRFDANGGTVAESTRRVENGVAIVVLPEPTYDLAHVFDGWFTDPDAGTQVTASTVITQDETFYAHWSQTGVAELDGVGYNSVQAAINAIPTNGVEKTVKLLKNVNEALTVNPGKNVKFNLQTYTIGNVGTSAIIENKGTITIYNGKLQSNSIKTAIINNNGGGLAKITGGQIIATGDRQAVYNLAGGTVEISGDAYIESSTTGTPDTGGIERGTIYNLAGGTITITGGTIIGTVQHAVSNMGTLTIGTQGGGINTSTPTIIGEVYGLNSTGTFNFYDGTIKGISGGISGTISAQEANTQLASGTEVIDAKTYITEYLTSN